MERLEKMYPLKALGNKSFAKKKYTHSFGGNSRKGGEISEK